MRFLVQFGRRYVIQLANEVVTLIRATHSLSRYVPVTSLVDRLYMPSVQRSIYPSRTFTDTARSSRSSPESGPSILSAYHLGVFCPFIKILIHPSPGSLVGPAFSNPMSRT